MTAVVVAAVSVLDLVILLLVPEVVLLLLSLSPLSLPPLLVLRSWFSTAASLMETSMAVIALEQRALMLQQGTVSLV